MKRLLFLIPVMAAGVPAAAQQKVAWGSPASPTVSVKMVAAVGFVRIVGWDRDSVDCSGIVPTGSKVELMAGSPSDKPAGMKMYVEVGKEQSAREGKLVLRVPRNARVWLKTGSADMDVSGVTGGVDLSVVGGSITIHGTPSDVRAESMDGNVVIEGAVPWVRAKTATGDITLHGGMDVAASTISGTIRTLGGDVERMKLEATTGTLVFASALTRGASVALETHSGPVEVMIPPRGPAEVDVETITGTIDNQWTYGRPSAGSEGRGMKLMASAGIGGGKVVVRTFKGAVQLRKLEKGG